MNPRIPMRNRLKRAFTLIELMVVVLILAVLAALVVPKIVGAGDKAKYQAAQSDMATIQGLLQRFHLDIGRYPSTEEGLAALRTAPAGLEGKWGPDAYATKEVANDPWGTPYDYQQDGNSYTLRSLAQDAAEGGDGYGVDIEVTD